MSRIFEALPGIEVPVGAISKGLAQMWEGAAAEGRPSPAGEQSMATQINLVLHLGFRTDADGRGRAVRDRGQVLEALSEPGGGPLPAPGRRRA